MSVTSRRAALRGAVFELGVPSGSATACSSMNAVLGGTLSVRRTANSPADVTLGEGGRLFEGLARSLRCGPAPAIRSPRPPGFQVVASSAPRRSSPSRTVTGRSTACCSTRRAHAHCADLLRTFAIDVCGCRGDWTMASFIDEAVAGSAPRWATAVGMRPVGRRRLDRRGAAVYKAIGERLTCIFSTTACCASRKRPRSRTASAPDEAPLVVFDAADRSSTRLAGVTDPENEAQDHRRRVHRVSRTPPRTSARSISWPRAILTPKSSRVCRVGPAARSRATTTSAAAGPDAVQAGRAAAQLFKTRRASRDVSRPGGRFRLAAAVPGTRLAGGCSARSPRRAGALRRADAVVQDEIRRPAGIVGSGSRSRCCCRSERRRMGDERTYEHTIAIRASRAGRHDRRLGRCRTICWPASRRASSTSQGHQPRRLRHQLEAAIDHRVE